VTQNPKNTSLVLWVKLCKAATKDINDAWRMYLPTDFEDVAGEENEQVFNVNQSKDGMSERESDSDNSSCAGGQ
jgi:hypothetical protein